MNRLKDAHISLERRKKIFPSWFQCLKMPEKQRKKKYVNDIVPLFTCSKAPK